ncbi:glycosyltransferase family 2 protein [Dankookia sp. P2]|uniref:glycosyltransferase family 2 protein n=1 Tax=Dankookia sp. P2 TaxID=3423955 RepID=UPI003D665BA9
MRLAIGIATRGRAAILAETLDKLERQTRRPDRIIVCHVTPEDVGAPRPGVEYLLSPAGLPRQRNAILDATADCDLLLFLDDDFLPAPDYCAVTEAVLAARPDCVVTTGTVLADGANAPGYSPEEGRAILARDRYAGGPLAAAAAFQRLWLQHGGAAGSGAAARHPGG